MSDQREPRHQSHAASMTCSEICDVEHKLHACPEFKKMSTSQKYDLVKKKPACFNCLQTGHSVSECGSKFSCRECKAKHHTLLHRPKPATTLHDGSNKTIARVSTSANTTIQSAGSAGQQADTSVLTGHCGSGSPNAGALLPTAMVPIHNKSGETVHLRALLDSGSQVSFITEAKAKALRLKVQKTPSTIITLGASSSQKTCGVLPATIAGSIDVNFHVIPKITGSLPNAIVDISQMRHVDHLKLADPNFSVPGKIDMLLGADIIEDLMLDNRIRDNGLILRESLLGWIVSGPILETSGVISTHHVTVASDGESNKLLARFWELESVPEKKHRTMEEAHCEELFDATTTRDSAGRFYVRLPFKADGHLLGQSRVSAMRRFINLENKLKRDKLLKVRYSDFVNEFLKLGHLEKVPDGELDNVNHYYMPHHCVLKDASTTTKLRVVFDASAKTTTGLSLNDCLMVGPKLQDDLFSILIRFRFFKVALSADVAKMYRQVGLDPRDRDFMRLLWRFSEDEPVQTFRLTRVIYGVASSSYHSIRCLREAAQLDGVPIAAKEAILRDFYVDDILTGASSIEEAEQLLNDLIQTLERVQFGLKKWTSNVPSLVLALPAEYREANENLKFLDPTHTIKTLGVTWNPFDDLFSFEVAHISDDINDDGMTKRQMLSDIAKTFDPLGWLSPVTMLLKSMMQRAWQTNVDWDQKLPTEIDVSYRTWRKNLYSLKEVKLQRFVLSEEQQEPFELHVFCDASEKAYAACVYVVSTNNRGERSSNLLVAKCKVSPLKTQSIPRLELCAVLLGSRLVLLVIQALERISVNIRATTGWSDSTIVLCWLSQEPSNWTTFVANRVAEIQRNDRVHWQHVPTEDNPADAASRGVEPSALKSLEIWWKGPTWLCSGVLPSQPKLNFTEDETKRPERQILHPRAAKKTPLARVVRTVPAVSLAVTKIHNYAGDIFDLSLFSSLSKLLRVVAYVKRFIQRICNRVTKESLDTISSDEMTEAMMILLRQEQKKVYSDEIKTLETMPQVKSTSKILKLYPFLFQGVLCVGGRLAHANLPDEAKYQRLVPKESRLATLVIKKAHLDTLHGGPNQVMAQIRSNFWIPNNRSVVRQELQQCVKCSRFTAKLSAPLMGDLPKERIDVPTRAFENVGLDFAGPFLCKPSSKARSQDKAYMALFVCFASKAVHIECVSDMTTLGCMAAIRRFISRRGCPSQVFSDNGTNFGGSANEIQQLQEVLSNKHDNSLQSQSSALGIRWNFIPPRAPHFGGLWEAAVKSAKKHLRRTMGNSVLTFEELTTLFCQIEAVLNSRPISVMSDDPNEVEPLTPAHLSIGHRLDVLPSFLLDQTHDVDNCSPSKRWYHIQNILLHFWNRWTKEYVTTLQERSKWRQQAI